MKREREIGRSAKTGRWMSVVDARRKKSTSVIEHVKVPRRKKN